MSVGKFSDQLNALAYASIDQANDLDTIYDDSATELKYIAAVERIKRSLGSGDISWMSALATLAAIDRAADKLVVWDNSANDFKSIVTSIITDMLYTLGSTKARNVLFYSADPTGATSSKQAMIDTLAALTDGDVVIIPPGNYVLTAFGSQAFTESRIHFLGIGQPILDFDGTGSLVCSGNQSDLTFEGIHFKNFGEALTPNSIDDTKTNFRVHRCKFYDATSAAASHYAIKMWCKIKGATVTDNIVENIGSSSGSAYGIVLGEKGDNATRTPDPTDEYDYGFDGSTWNTAEGNMVVTGNRITKLRGNSDEVTAILLDGWRGNVANNVIGDISSSSTGGVGVYVRGHDFNVQGNNIADCSHSHVVVKGAPSGSDPTVGETGHTIISGNTFRKTTIGNTNGAIELDNGNVKIVNNKFIRLTHSNSGGGLIYDGGWTNVEVMDNEFYKCTGRMVQLPHGEYKKVLRNKVILPLGNGASECELFSVTPNTANASQIEVCDNEVILGTNYAGTNTLYVVRILPTAGRLITGLTVRNNTVKGMAAFRTVNATTVVYLVQAMVRTNNQTSWIIEDNWADEWNASYTIPNDVQLSGATAFPTDFVQRMKNTRPVTMAADFTMNGYFSGVVLDNLAQTADRVVSLPAPRYGLEVTAENVASGYLITLDPNGVSEKIGDGGAGKYLRLNKMGRVKLLGISSTQWVIQEMTCWDDPGSSGTPVPGIIWET